MNTAKKLLKEYQRNKFSSRAIDDFYQGFEYKAYPETARGNYLESIGKALRILPAYNRNGVKEMEESLRARIILALETPDPEEENRNAA